MMPGGRDTRRIRTGSTLNFKLSIRGAALTTIEERFLYSPGDEINVVSIAKMKDEISPYGSADERSMEQIESPEFVKNQVR
jgi:hypothetical protein